MTTLRRFTPPTQEGIIHVQESIQPDEVILQIEHDAIAATIEVAMTQAQFRELCRLGVPSPYDRDQDTVQFQPAPIPPPALYSHAEKVERMCATYRTSRGSGSDTYSLEQIMTDVLRALEP
jgi:hypothetical protein